MAEIDRQVDRIRTRAEEEIKDLLRRKDALKKAYKVITPELEAAVAALEAVGISLS